jgi:hypothetical protein
MSTGILTQNQFPADFVKKSFAGMIMRLMPSGNAPLFGLTSMLGTENASRVEHGFFTKTMLFPQVTLAAAVANATDTTFTVTSTTNIIPGMVLQANSTKEQIIVNSIISSTQLTVSRGVGVVSAAAISNGVDLYQVGNAFEEASVRPNAQNIIPVRITNFTQIFRNTWALSDTTRETLVIAGEDNVSESKMDATMFHAADIEKALFFGQKSQGTRNGQPFRTMDGLESIVSNLSYYPSSYAAANVFTAGATTNYTQLEGFVDPVFNQNTDPRTGNQRFAFVGGTALKVINNICRLNGNYQLIDGQTSWGFQFKTLKFARGTIQLVEHPLFNTNANWSKYMFVVDTSTFKTAYLGNRKTQYKEFNMDPDNCAQDNGIDAVGGTLTTEVTCVIKNPPANSIVYNLTAAAAG